MKNRFILLLAIILGIFSATLVYVYINGVTSKFENSKYVNIIVAKVPITEKSVILETMLVKKKILIGEIMPLNITRGSEIIGKIALYPINQGEEILSNQIISIGDNKEGLRYTIPTGKRAFMIPELTGISALLKPGDRVDVIANVAGNEETPINYTALVLEDIEVLSIGNDMGAVTGGTQGAKTEVAKTIVLSVSVKESLKLKMAVERGTVSVILRPPTDKIKAGASTITVDEIIKKSGR